MQKYDSFVALIEAMNESRFHWTKDFETQNRLKLAVFLKLLAYEKEFRRNCVTVGIFHWCIDRRITGSVHESWFTGLRQLHPPGKIDSYASTVIACPEPTARNVIPYRPNM